LQRLDAGAQVGRQQAPRLLGEIEEDRAGLEDGQGAAACRGLMVDDRRDLVVGRDREKRGRELLAGGETDRDDPVRHPGLLEEEPDLEAVRRGAVVQVDHGVLVFRCRGEPPERESCCLKSGAKI
jgi:hypothetical protein